MALSSFLPIRRFKISCLPSFAEKYHTFPAFTIGIPVEGVVSLQGAAAGELVDDWGSGRNNGFWPTGGQLRLDGFTYGRLGGAEPATVRQRLAWIRSQYQPKVSKMAAPFATQPYEQLASVYRQAGQDTEARRVAIARRSDLREYGNLSPLRRAGNWLLDKSIKYGYQTWRAVAGLVLLYLIVLALSVLAQHHGLIAPVGNVAGLHPVPVATRCTSNYPCFYPAGYAIDTVIPIINVHQATYWGPNGDTPWGWIWIAWHMDRDWARMGAGDTARRRLHRARAPAMMRRIRARRSRACCSTAQRCIQYAA